MPSLSFPFLTVAVLLPLAAALFLAKIPESRRRATALLAVLGTAVCGVAASLELWLQSARSLADPLFAASWSRPLLSVDTLGAFALVVYAIVAIVLFSSMPRRDSTLSGLRNHLWILAGATLAYSAENLLLLFLGWVVASLPLVIAKVETSTGDKPRWHFPQIAMVSGSLCLGIAFVLMVTEAYQASGVLELSITRLAASPAMVDHVATLVFLMLAVLLRKGVFPLHSWVTQATEQYDLLQTIGFVNTHLGVFVLAKVAIPLLPHASAGIFHPLTDLALITALLTSLMAVAAMQPRTMVALLAASQSSFILAGIGSGSAEAITGALMFWAVVSLATTAIFVVLRSLEVRLSTPLTLRDFHGFGHHAPRLAVFFLVSALALVGLPGTLGFCAEDLLLHGTLEAHPFVGILLPIATAINAISFLRLFNRLFLGKRGIHVPNIADAMPRERWALATVVMLIILTGLLPGTLVNALSKAAHEHVIETTVLTYLHGVPGSAGF